MNPNLDKIDDAVLALLYFTTDFAKPTSRQGFAEGKGELTLTRAWKSRDWEPRNRLGDRGFISDPKNKYKSVVLTQEGQRNGEGLFQRSALVFL
jgi:hypothetical protein